MKRTLFIWLHLCACAGWLRAAESSFVVDTWGTEDRLPQSSVISLVQTRDGYLWLGTLNGLVRFDGHAFTRFTVNNTPGLPENRIVFLYEDSKTNLWAGTESAGLCLMRKGTIQVFPTGSAEAKVICAAEDSDGNPWFSTQDGRYFCWKDGRLEAHPGVFPAFLFYRAARLVVPGTDGITWHLQNGRVERWRKDVLEMDFGAVPWGNSPLSSAVLDPAGNMAVGTYNSGIFWMDSSGAWRHLTTEDGLSSDTILSLCVDREGNLWAGTDGGGLCRIRKKLFSIPSGLPLWTAQSLAEDGQGGIWAAFNARGLVHFASNSTATYGIGSASNAWCVMVDSRQQVWAGTRGEGLFRFMSYYFQPVIPASRIGRQIYALCEGRNGRVWIGADGGLACFENDSWKFYTSKDGLPPNAIRALAEDIRGVLWIGSEGRGMFRLEDGRVSQVASPLKDVSCIYFDQENVLWAGSPGHGLARFQGGGWVQYTTRTGLPTDNIGYLVDDNRGNLWIGSYDGILCASKTSLNDFAAGAIPAVSCRVFLTRECGLGAQPAAIRARDGKVWLPTAQGVVCVNPVEIQSSTNPPPVVIESVFVDGVEQGTALPGSGWQGAVELSPAAEQLEIRFAGLNFSAPKGAQFGARFKYILEGRDKYWTDIAAERVVHIPQLAPGAYVFRVKAGNVDGIWNDTGASLGITVHPPFWRKPWFLAVSSLSALGLLAGVIYLVSTAKLKRQLRAARQKEAIEHERARIARDLHDQLGANLTQVALLGEMAEADKHIPSEVEDHARQISATARETTRSLDEIVWAVNPQNDTIEGLANYCCKYAQDYFALASVSFRPELPALPATPILPEVRHNVFLAFKEAVNNVVKHAQASEARISLRLDQACFILTVADNGRGIGDLTGKELRNGLKNMRKRINDIHGACEIAPNPGGGTIVTFAVPLSAR